MLKLTHINISYDKPVIVDGTIEIPHGRITAITGDSGSGKTSILYLLGALSTEPDCIYDYNGTQLNLSDEETASQLRRESFGFVFQDSSLINELTVAENIRYMAHLSGRDIADDEIRELLNEVDLMIDAFHIYPAQLSGGEQQRAALAAVLSKRPSVIFADEPTSSLDKTNTQLILDIFHRLTNTGITVVLATHSDAVSNNAEVVYEINNKKVVIVKGERYLAEERDISKRSSRTHKFNIRDAFRYVKATQRKNKVLHSIITVFCAFAITGFSLTNSVLDALGEAQASLLKQISNRELFVVNQAYPESDIRDHDGNLSLSPEVYSKISNLDGVEEVFPFCELRSFSLLPEARVLETEVEVTTNLEQETFKFNLFSEKDPYFIVLPYNHAHKLEQQTEAVFPIDDSELPIYLSHEMADSLNLFREGIHSIRLSFQIGVPVAKMESPVEYDQITALEEIDILSFRKCELTIAGILDENVTNRYTINGDKVIYIPQEMMENIVSQAIQEHDVTVQMAPTDEQLIKPWRPSSVLVYSRTADTVKAVQNKLQNIDPKFAIRYDFQDSAAIEEMVLTLKKTSNIVLAIVLVIIFVLMASVFISTTVGRKKEIALLKANGITNRKLLMVVMTDSLYRGVKILAVALTISIVLSIVGSELLLATVSILSYKTILLVTLISIAFVLVPTVFSIVFTIRIEPARILRNS